MASEKGATYLDRLCHKFYDEPKGHGNKTDYVCRLCGGPLETYYCEERLYLVKCADCGTFSLVKTANPEDAARVTLARPTLTPPNEPLTIEQLREMDGEPVWFVDIKGRKWYPPGWAIVDRENCLVRLVKSWNPIFFEKYGEWWIAYRRPPEGGEINKITVVQHLGRLEDVALRPVSREQVEKFKEYFDDLYGKGLEVYGWHMNGEAKSFDDFYEDACEYAGL